MKHILIKYRSWHIMIFYYLYKFIFLFEYLQKVFCNGVRHKTDFPGPLTTNKYTQQI